MFFGIPRADEARLIFSKVMELPGWAGMFARMESHPYEAPQGARVRLLDFCAVQSTLARASITDTALHAGWNPAQSSFSEWLRRMDARAPGVAAAHVAARQGSALLSGYETVQASSAVAWVDQTAERRELIEAEVEHGLLSAIDSNTAPKRERQGKAPPELQVFTCIDDRECSLRRHIEDVNPRSETFGIAGFFGLPVRYVSIDGEGDTVLAPEGQHPSAVLAEVDVAAHPGDVKRYQRNRRIMAHFSKLWEGASFSPFGSLVLSAAFPLSLARLVLNGYAPVTKQRVRDAFRNTFAPRPKTDFAPPFAPSEAAAMLSRTLKSIGATREFAPLVLVLGHGAASANNPFAAAYNCGACGGRDGGPNARLFARVANDPDVRALLARDHDIVIPAGTVFVGGKHNTTADEIEYVDLERLPASHAANFANAASTLEIARGRNALERCQRFLLAENVTTADEALAHVHQRAVDTAEVRPELNHSSNAAVVVGRRELTRGCFLDRRAFLPSYDPNNDDDDGTLLEGVLAPALTVCSVRRAEFRRWQALNYRSSAHFHRA